MPGDKETKSNVVQYDAQGKLVDEGKMLELAGLKPSVLVTTPAKHSYVFCWSDFLGVVA